MRSIGDPGSAGRNIRPTLTRADAPPDTVADGGDLAGAIVRGASVRGLTHRIEEGVRQDSFAVTASADRRWVLVAVADGVGSARRSDVGSATAVATALLQIAADPRETDWVAAFSAVERDLLSIAQDAGAADVHTTLTVVAAEVAPTSASSSAPADVPHGPDTTREVLVAWIGDSPVWLLRDGAWHPLTGSTVAPDGLYDTAVSAMPSGRPPRLVRLAAETGDLIVAMSDGVGTPLAFAVDEVGDQLARWWERPPTLAQFADQVGFARRGFTDDRTAVAIWMLR